MSSPPRVAYLANSFPRWGGGWLLNEVRGVMEAGIDLVVFSFKRPPDDVAAQPGMQAWIDRTVYLRTTDRRALRAGALSFARRRPAAALRSAAAALRVGGRTVHFRHLIEVLYLARRMEEKGVRHVHAQHADYVADMSYAAAVALGVPFSFAAHARDLYTQPGRLPVKIRAAGFVATCTGFNETYLKDLCARARGLDPEKIIRLYHGVDLDRFTFRSGDRPAARLVSISRLKEKKGFPYLLEALVRLRRSGRDVSLEIYGDGDQRDRILAETARLGLTGRVALKGAIEHRRIPEVLAGAGIFVLPCIVMPDQDRDGIPNTMIEAMACGVPVVTTAISGIPEVVRDGQSGLLVPERDPAALAAAIERMLEDEELRQRCVRGARRMVESNFSVEATGRALAGLFRRAAGPAGTAL